MDDGDEITSIRVVYVHLPPFVEIKEIDGQEVVEGFMPAIVRAVTKWMNLNVTWIREPGDMYGFWNGTDFTGMLGMLSRNEVDLLVNPIIPESEVRRIAFFTNPITVEAFTMLSGREKHEGGLFLYFSVLQHTVWSAIGLALLAIAIASAVLYLRLANKSTSTFLTMLQYVWVYVAYMLRQVPNEKWMLRKKRVFVSFLMPFLVMTWMIGVAFLVMTVFQSLLVSKLAIVKQYPVVDTLEDFVSKSSVKGLTPREIELQIALKGSGNEIYDKTWEKLEPDLVDSFSVFSDKTLGDVERGKSCIFHGHLILRSVLSEYYKKKGRCNFHLSENYFFPFPLLMAIRKTLSRRFKDKFNLGISRLVDADLSGKWFKPIFKICHLCTSYSENDLKPLSLNSIFGVLVIWTVGMTLATISVIAENVFFNSKQNKKKISH